MEEDEAEKEMEEISESQLTAQLIDLKQKKKSEGGDEIRNEA